MINAGIDKYFSCPITFDIVIICLGLVISHLFPIFTYSIPNQEGLLNLSFNLCSTGISLSGFILAALTIIVTFKSNIGIKGLKESENGMQLIFSTKYYKNIVSVFKGSITELVIASCLLYLSISFSSNYSSTMLNKINIIMIFIVVSSTARSLFVLFKIIDLENKS